MIRHFYSKGIVIYGFEGKSLQSGTMLSSTDANTFFTLVKRHLASLEQLKIGRELVESINASGKTCTIFMIVLGHELIHAWRMMLGRRLMGQGWEEEAMTTGLYKFADLEFTENKLRGEANLPMRAKYQKGFCSSQWMDVIAYQNSNY